MPRYLSLCKRVFTVGVVLTGLYSPAFAAPAIDAAGATHVKTMFQSLLDKRAQESQGKLELDGDLMVEPANGFYAVTLPHITTVAPDGSRTKIGMIAMNVSPTDKSDVWKMTMALPTPITYYDPAGKPAMTVDIGKQSFAGTWYEKMEGFVQAQAQYQSVAIKALDGSFNARIADAQTVYDLKQQANGNWSGPVSLRIGGLDIAEKDGGTVKTDMIESRMDIQDYSFEQAKALRGKLQALAHQPATTADQRRQAFLNLLAEPASMAWGGFDIRNSVKNVAASQPAQDGKPASTMRIGDGFFNMKAGNLRQNNVTLSLALNYRDFGITPPPPQFDTTMPDRVNVDVRLDNIALKDVLPLLGAQMDGKALADRVVALATQSGTVMTVNDMTLANDAFDANLKGILKADQAAAYKTVGTGKIVFAGLEGLTAAVGAQIADPATSAADKQRLQKVAAMLAIMQLVGQQGTSASGKPARVYDLELKQNGQIMLNGADIGSVLAK